jgi:predicted ATPase
MPRLIVLTGGPGAGKTTLCSHFASRFPDRFVQVPEAASQIYRSLNTRWDQLDDNGRRDVQRRIYQLQLEQESEFLARHPTHHLLLDRGSVDGAAYWPDGCESYWLALHTTHEHELKRYDAVIWLESGAAIGRYDGSASNPCRFEDASDALATGEKLANVWRSHPQFLTVLACDTIDQKIAQVDELLETFAGSSQ